MSVFTDLLCVRDAQGDKGMVRDLLAAVRNVIGFPFACLVSFEGAKVDVIAFSDTDDRPRLRVGRCDPDAETYFQMLRDGEIVQVIPNTIEDPMARFLRWFQRGPVGSIVSLPIRDPRGQIVAAVCTFSPIPSNIGPKDLKILKILTQIAANIVNAPPLESNKMSQLRHRIRNIVSEARVDIHLQPIVELKTGVVRGYEALSRFSGADLSSDPHNWFEDAKHVGMQSLLECSTMAEAVELLQFLPSDTCLSINASPETVRTGAVAEILRDAPPERTVLDLKIRHFDGDLGDLEYSLAELRNIGVQLAIDNVGAGSLQFPALVRLRPDILKLDISIVKSINRREHSQKLTSAFVKFSNEIDAVLIAVGIEHERERATLARLGVTFGQGYLLAKPNEPKRFGIGGC